MEEPEEPYNGWMPGLRPFLLVAAAYFVLRLLNWWAGGAAPWESW